MGRYYALSKKVTKEQASIIIQTMKQHKEVDFVSLDENGSEILVVTENHNFSVIMNYAVNVCKRVAQAELSFERFAV